MCTIKWRFIVGPSTGGKSPRLWSVITCNPQHAMHCSCCNGSLIISLYINIASMFKKCANSFCGFANRKASKASCSVQTNVLDLLRSSVDPVGRHLAVIQCQHSIYCQLFWWGRNSIHRQIFMICSAESSFGNGLTALGVLLDLDNTQREIILGSSHGFKNGFHAGNHMDQHFTTALSTAIRLHVALAKVLLSRAGDVNPEP